MVRHGSSGLQFELVQVEEDDMNWRASDGGPFGELARPPEQQSVFR